MLGLTVTLALLKECMSMFAPAMSDKLVEGKGLKTMPKEPGAAEADTSKITSPSDTVWPIDNVMPESLAKSDASICCPGELVLMFGPNNESVLKM